MKKISRYRVKKFQNRGNFKWLEVETGRRKCKITNLALHFIFYQPFPIFFVLIMTCIVLFFSPPPLAVNHLPPTGKRQSVCQETIHQQHTDSDICHLGIFVLRKYMLAARGPPGNFPQHKVLCVFSFLMRKRLIPHLL